LETLQGSVVSFRDEASEETREHAEALVRHLSEVTDNLRSCSGRGGDNSQLFESAMREMSVQMKTMTSELTAIRENVSRISAEVANLGTEMSRVVEGNAALQNKLFDLSDGIKQLLKDEDIPSTCGLRQVICNGKVGWVLDRDDVVEAFRERCLR
jgi:uncharacterized protein YukE